MYPSRKRRTVLGPASIRGKKLGRTGDQQKTWRENEWSIFQCLSEFDGHEISVTFIHSKTGINRKHVYSHLNELQAKGVVEKFHGRWRLKPRIKALIENFIKGWYFALKYSDSKLVDPRQLLSCCDMMNHINQRLGSPTTFGSGLQAFYARGGTS